MERRKGARHLARFEVLVSTNDVDSFILEAADISDFGIYVLSDGNKVPPIGSVVQVKLNGNIGNERINYPLLDMVIKRVDSQGLGLQVLKSH